MSIRSSARGLARRLGLGRARDSLRWHLNSSSWWSAVPPLRLKDLGVHGAEFDDAVALTYDDGPNPAVTPALLELLAERNASATFFVCGRAIERYPGVLEDIDTAGHGVGGHTWDHPHSGIRGIDGEAYRHQIDRTHGLIEERIQKRVDMFRPPRGIIDAPTWRRLLERDGLTTVMWSVDARDCTERDPNEIANRVLAEIEPGSIVLLHDANANFFESQGDIVKPDPGNQETTLEVTAIVLDGLRKLGLRSVSLDSVPRLPMAASGQLRRRRN